MMEMFTFFILFEQNQRKFVIAKNPVEIYCFFRAGVSFFAYAPGPDLAGTAPVVRICLKKNKAII